MKTNSKWMPTTVLAVVVTLTTAMMEPAAFGKDPLPNRPVFKVAQAIAQPQPAPVPTRTVLPSTPPKPQQDKSKSKKWIFIIAAAGAAGATAFLVGRGTPGPEPHVDLPAIVVGTPIVGQPQ